MNLLPNNIRLIPFPESFYLKFIPEPMSGCWLWLGALDKYGYAVLKINHIQKKGSRVSWELYKGEIEDGLHIDHKCRNTACVNPDHLEPVTPKENTRRGLNVDLKTHCGQGHLWIEENIYNNKGKNYCKICRSIRWLKLLLELEEWLCPVRIPVKNSLLGIGIVTLFWVTLISTCSLTKAGETGDWYKSLHQPATGINCCSESDCGPVDDGDLKIENGNYYYLWQDQWQLIEEGKVLEVPNPVGSPILCRRETLRGLLIFCFVPGVLS